MLLVHDRRRGVLLLIFTDYRTLRRRVLLTGRCLSIYLFRKLLSMHLLWLKSRMAIVRLTGVRVLDIFPPLLVMVLRDTLVHLERDDVGGECVVLGGRI